MQLFYLFQNFFQIQSCEEDFRFFCYMTISELLQNLFACGWHKGFQKLCTAGNALNEVPENCFQTVFFCFIFCEYPWHCLVNVFVAAFEEIENFCHCICHTQLFHLVFDCFWCAFCHCLQICINLFCHTFVCYSSAEIFICHGNGSVDQISQRVGKIRIHALYHQFPCDNSIIFKWHLMKNKVTNCINAEEIYQFICVKDVSFGFTHFSVSLKQPWMSEYLFWKRKIQCHQKDWPVNCMEANDIFSDQMQICRP